jgi:predicted  nucleic acid-binding Zn-ribbon protein
VKPKDQKLTGRAEEQAQIEALQKRKDELTLEWNSLNEKRSELHEFHKESEQKQRERVEIETALAKAQAELNDIKDKLVAKEELDRSIEALRLAKAEAEDELRKLNDEVSELKQIKSDADRLRNETNELRAIISDLDRQKTSMSTEMQKLETETQEVIRGLAEKSSERTEFLAQYNAEIIDRNSVLKEKDQLTAELEVLKVLIADEQGKRGGKKPVQDRLAKLKTSPPSVKLFEDLPEVNFLDEKSALENVRLQFRSEGLVYDERVLNAFHTTMKTNETTQMAVLAGISGTGKSQLPRQYATGMGIGFLQIPVQPRWDSPQDLMGFYNYIESEFKPTDMARALYAMDIHNNPDAGLGDRMMMILLDEMNLARVEYYFSDFLSRLESRPRRDLVADANKRKDAEIELEIPDANEETVRLFPGFNLLFSGTMNEDESTQSLSDKVVDRANVLKFGAPKNFANSRPEGDAPEPRALSKTQWDKWVRQPETLGSDEQFVNTKIDEMAAIMKSFGRPFGHRLRLAMKSYVANYPESDRYNGRKKIETALADQIEIRLLPKLRGLDPEESAISQAFGDLSNMIKQDLGDGDLAKAVQTSIDNAAQNSQFNWSGVTR